MRCFLITIFFVLYGAGFACGVSCDVDFEKSVIEKFALPETYKCILDRFCQKYGIKKKVSLFRRELRRGNIKKYGQGFHIVAGEIQELENRFLLKIPRRGNSWVSPERRTGSPAAWFPFCRGRRCISRVLKADMIREMIAQYDIKGVYVPKKYFYRIPGVPGELNDANYLVIVEKVDLLKDGLSFENISVEQIEDIAKIMVHADLIDAHDKNVGIDSKGNVVFLDTEDGWYFMLFDGLLTERQTKDLASFCADRLCVIVEQNESFAEVAEILQLKKIVDGTCSDIALLKNIIVFYKQMKTFTKINVIMNSIETLDKESLDKIMRSIKKEWSECFVALLVLDDKTKDFLLSMLLHGQEEKEEPEFLCSGKLFYS